MVYIYEFKKELKTSDKKRRNFMFKKSKIIFPAKLGINKPVDVLMYSGTCKSMILNITIHEPMGRLQ